MSELCGKDLTTRLVSATQSAFSASVDEDQTAQNVQSDLGSRCWKNSELLQKFTTKKDVELKIYD